MNLFVENKVVINFHRGHTHGEFELLQNSPVASTVGRWCRENLVEKEYVPDGMRRSPSGKWYKCYAHWEIKHLFVRYNKRSQRMHVPIAYCDDIIGVIKDWGAYVKEDNLIDYELRKLSTHMNPKFTDRPKQVEPIKNCSVRVPGMKGLNLQTGGGKTYCAVKVAMNLGYATLIIVPGLVEQWIDDIDEYTSARKGGEIYKIEGFQSLATLAQHPEYKPDFFVASTRTMQMFCNCDSGYEVLPWSYSEFFKAYGIGCKIVDECHKQFHANTLMDLQTNVPYNLYLSATFDQTSKTAREVFNRIFPRSMRYGGETYDKYVTVYFFNFYGNVLPDKCVRAKGYMHALYESELMKSDCSFNSHVDNLILPLINQYYTNRYQKGHRCLVFCSTIEFVNKLTERLKSEFPKLRVGSYTANSPRSVLENSDLVVSTIGKASTGLDWKGLRCCLNTVSVRSPVLTSQMLGRLRKINGEKLIYIDVCDLNIPSQMRHAEDRKADLSRMAAKFCVYNGLHDSTLQADDMTALSGRI